MPKPRPKATIRKPPSTDDMDRFMDGDLAPSNIQELRPTEPIEPTEKPKGRGMVTRASGRIVRRLTVYVDPEVAQRLKVRCAVDGLDMSDVASKALDQYLKSIEA